MRRWFPAQFALLCLGLTGLPAAVAAGDVRGTTTIAGEREGAATAGRLQAALELEAKKEWDGAVEEYSSILANAGNELVPLSAHHFVQARWRCHRQLARMPAEALALYRKRADAQAKKWYEAGAAERDPRQLRRVVDEAFCSSPAEAALDLLGELAFEQGKTEEAERWWRMLARPASQAEAPDKPPELDCVYPLPRGDVARYRAKQLLARLFRGDPFFAAEFKAFRALHPKSEGWLAGRKGNFGEILQSLSERSDLAEGPRPADAWTTFAGDATRNRVLPPPPDRNWLSRLCEEEPARFDLGKHRLSKPDGTATPPRKNKGPSPSESAPSLAFFPIILDHKVVVADTNGVTVYDPLTGAVHDWTLEIGPQGEGKRETKLPAPADLRCTLTAAGQRLFVRLGSPLLDPTKKEQSESNLVCLEWSAEVNELRERWHVAAARLDKPQTVFEGSPLVDGDRAFAAFTRLDDRASTGVVCLDASTGAVRWRQDVCESAIDWKQPRYRHHLLTLAGSNVVYCSHSGVIASLDAATGKRVWAVRYQQPALLEATSRDLTPCLFDGSRLFIAPADSNRILCLDAATGCTLWERDNIEVVHLLGVADGRLIFNTQKEIRAVRAGNGLDEWRAPVDALKPYTDGRGLILCDLVFYPTGDGLKVLNLQDGQPTDRLNIPNGRLGGVRGHLAYADGILAVTDRTQLTVFVAPALLRKQRREDALIQPNSVMAHYRLALAETDATNMDGALREWQRVEELAKPDDRRERRPLRAHAQRQRHDLLLYAADLKRADRRWEDADAFLRRASAQEFPTLLRSRALAQRAILWEKANEPARAMDAWQAILNQDDRPSDVLFDEAGNPQIGTVWVEARIDALLRANGRRVVESIEQKASAVGSATALCRSRLRHCTDTKERARILASVASLYEAEHCWAAAIHAWQQLGEEVPATGLGAAVWRGLSEAQVRRIQARAAQAAAPPELQLPWRRAGETPLEAGDRPMPMDDTSGIVPSELFFANGRTLACYAADTGKQRWRRTLPWEPDWIGCQDDWLLAGGQRGVGAWTLDGGSPLWTYAAPPSHESQETGDTPAALGAFCVRDGKLFFLQGERRLFALDAETGLVLWSRWAPDARLGWPSGRFFPNYQANGDRVVIQTGAGKWWLLDAAGGRLIHEGETVREPWPQAVTMLDRRRWCLATNPEQVVLFDAETGAMLWTFEIPGKTISSGMLPLVLSSGAHLGLLLPRNYGYTLQRLDPSSGKALWEQERLISTEPLGPENIALDDTAFYVGVRNVTSAYAMENGRLLWERPLAGPEGSWRLTLFRDQLVVYPSEARAFEFQLRGPFGALECTMAAFADDPTRQGFPVILADPKTGNLDQRLNFRMPRPRIQVRIAADIGLKARFRQVPPPSPTRVRFAGAAATVVLPDRFWRLTARRTDP